jgi:hypothetical protein
MSDTITAPSTTTPTQNTPWYRRTWVIAVVAGLVGLIIGAAGAGSTDPTTTAEYKALSAKLDTAASARDDAESKLANAQEEVSAAQQELSTKLGDIPAREDAVSQKEAALNDREAALTAKDKEVTTREKAVGLVEKDIAANTIDGEGIYEVGSDITAGKYKTEGGSDCYYAILNSTDTSDIADNGNVSGPAFVTVRNGQYLELSGCAEWTLQR